MELFRIVITLPVLVLSQAVTNPLRLSHHCSGVVEALHLGVWRAVTFDPAPETWVKVAGDICANLSCGAVYEMGQNGTATFDNYSSTCLGQCVYRDFLVENCTTLSNTDCSNLTEITCGHQAVRLVDGAHPCKGRVELWREGSWGTVCDDSWDIRDGGVVCAQLGCGFALNVSGEDGSFKAGVGPILLDEVNCGGSERNLWECPSLGMPNDCGHKEDAALICSGSRVNQPDNETTTQPNVTTELALPSEDSVPMVTSTVSKSSPITAAAWGCIALSIALVFTLLSNTLLFLSYRRRAAFLNHQPQDGQLLSTQSRPIERNERVNLLTVTTETADYTPQALSRLNNDANTSIDSDNGDYISVTMATATGHSLKSASTSSGECYENIETFDSELPTSGPRETALSDGGRKQSSGSSSTSSGGSYENLTEAIKDHLDSANTYLSSPVQSTSTHQDQQQPGETDCHQQANQDPDDSSSSSSSELYENVEVNDEDGICAAIVREDPDQTLSDSDYDDVDPS
ncbi:hypothetical protein DPEC_G00352660 [Dallia pectoralis]|uniref:Uncharacterized protein n=1 Tax=Dallia pectoralis TaxID=75939 RepID=A0ACC2F2B0_DALPE|nr:hypothetical protein DPEC_G00352660 [Dallia pectoralis]